MAERFWGFVVAYRSLLQNPEMSKQIPRIMDVVLGGGSGGGVAGGGGSGGGSGCGWWSNLLVVMAANGPVTECPVVMCTDFSDIQRISQFSRMIMLL